MNVNEMNNQLLIANVVHDICRLCLCDKNELINLNENSDERASTVIEKMSSVTGIKIFENDPFPPWVCVECASKLEDAAEFIETCSQSQTFLEAIYERGNFKNDEGPEDIGDDSLLILAHDELEEVLAGDCYEVPSNDDLAGNSTPLAPNANNCSDCSLDFATSNELWVHRVGVHHDDLLSQRIKKPKVLSCDKCKITLNSSSSLSIHKKCHRIKSLLENPLQSVLCRYCGNRVSSSAWVGHMDNYHKIECGDAMLRSSKDCRICLRPFVRLQSLYRHIQTFHPNEMEEVASAEGWQMLWTCIECDSTFEDEDIFDQHCISNHGSDNTTVPFEKRVQQPMETCECGYLETSPVDDHLHRILVHSDQETCTSCPGCESVFLSIRDLYLHLVSEHRIITTGVGRQCLLCARSFGTYELLKGHLQSEHDVSATVATGGGQVEVPEQRISQQGKSTVYWCPQCSKVFASKMKLHQHFKRRHMESERQFVCSFCGKQLNGLAALRAHEDGQHKGVRKHACPNCPLAFSNSQVLKKHQEVHMADRPTNTCAVCGREFTTASGYSRHVQTHFGVKSFLCAVPLCEKAFYTMSELKRHGKWHTQDFKHECEVCGRRFLSPTLLSEHQAKHSGERPFRCHLCTAAYACRSNWSKHLRTVHKVRSKRVYGNQSAKKMEEHTPI